MSGTTIKPVWSFDPEEWRTTVREVGPHPCGCAELYMITHHCPGHVGNTVQDIKQLPEFWATGRRNHYRDCPKRTV